MAVGSGGAAAFEGGNLEVCVDDLLELVVDDQHEGAAGSAQHVGPGSLEEGLASLLPVDLAPRVDGAVVVLSATGLHAHTAVL